MRHSSIDTEKYIGINVRYIQAYFMHKLCGKMLLLYLEDYGTFYMDLNYHEIPSWSIIYDSSCYSITILYISESIKCTFP